MASIRLRFGLLINDLEYDHSYSDLVWRTALSWAESHNADLFVFPVKSLNPTREADLPHNAMAGLAAASNLNGMVVVASVCDHLEAQHHQVLSRQFASMPLVSVGVRIADRPCVHVDNRRGIAELMDHLILEHGRRVFACLPGPTGNEEATQRLAEYKDSLCRHGLVPEPALISAGPFDGTGVEESLALVLGSGISFDTLVCGCDLIAVRAIESLRRRGFRVPEDIAVTGFDDLPFVLDCWPLLSTVEQPISFEVQTAFDQVLALSQGQVVPADTMLPSKAIIRGSCGCPHGSWVPFSTQAQFHSLDSMAIHRVLTESHGNYMNLQSHMHRLNTLSAELTMTDSISHIDSLLNSTLPQLGIHSYMISLFPQTGAEKDSAESGILVSRRGDVLLPPPPLELEALFGQVRSDSGFYLRFNEHQRFKAEDFAPVSWFETRGAGHLVALPLSSGTTWYGLLICELNFTNALFCRGLQEQLSSLLHRESKVNSLHKDIVAAKVHQAVEFGRLSTLNNLVTGLAHQLNTPLGNSITASSYLDDRIDQARALCKTEDLRLVQVQSELKEGISLLHRNMLRISKLVERFKLVSGASFIEEASQIDLRLLAESMRIFNADRLERSEVDFIIHGSGPVMVESIPGVLRQVLDNLLDNVIVHAKREDGIPTRAELRFTNNRNKRKKNTVTLLFGDNGPGIPPDLISRLFEPFATSRGHLGSVGLGLHVVWNLVRLTLGGTIVWRDDMKPGAWFELELPGKTPSPSSLNLNVQTSDPTRL